MQYVEVPDGEGLIAVVGRTDASVPLLAGDPAAVAGGVGGSTERVAARARDPRTAVAEVKALGEWPAAPPAAAAARPVRAGERRYAFHWEA
ncbi:hypothetical protein GCM10009678_64810 [Actinomadura kijaniata]